MAPQAVSAEMNREWLCPYVHNNNNDDDDDDASLKSRSNRVNARRMILTDDSHNLSLSLSH